MNLAQHILTAMIRAYRWLVSPLLVVLFSPGGICRFTPSCSEYALGAVRDHGAFRGARLAARRLLRCHPWGECGHDPVPACAGSCSTGSRGVASNPASAAGGTSSS